MFAVGGDGIGGGGGQLSGRAESGAIGRMVGVIQEIADNNLAMGDIKADSEDDIGKADAALNRMKNNLRGIILSIAATPSHVASASEELSSSATQPAQRAHTQTDQTLPFAPPTQSIHST